MTNEEKIQSFGEMVSASEKITQPWRKFCCWILAALVVTNLIWGFVFWWNLKWAYMTPTEVSQEQLFDQQTQTQYYSEGATGGK